MKYRIGVFVLTILSLVTVGWAAELCQHDLMVRGGAVYLAMRGDIGAGNLEAAQLKARELVDVSKEIQYLWVTQNTNWQVDDGVEWAQDSHQKSIELLKILEEGDLDAAAAALQATGQACGACHQKYRPARRTRQ